VEGEKSALTDVAPAIGEWSRWGEFERLETRETLGKQGPETRTGRRFEASACRYNTRVKLSLKPLIQLSGTDTSRNEPVFSRPGYGFLSASANNLAPQPQEVSELSDRDLLQSSLRAS
jgi:hypothetical protein